MVARPDFRTKRNMYNHPSSDADKVVISEDFLGDSLVDTSWTGTGGTDAQAVATFTEGHPGSMILVSGNVGDEDDAANASTLTMSALNWKSNTGGLVVEARLELSAITEVTVFVGFTDVQETAEVPIEASGTANGVDDNATDAAGLMFDTDMTDDVWGPIGTKNGTVTTWPTSIAGSGPNAGVAPVAGELQRIRVEIDAAGTLTGFVNDVMMGNPVSNAVTITVALTPVVSIMARTAASPTATIEYIRVEANRIAD